MEISLIADKLTVAAIEALRFSKSVNHLSLCNSSSSAAALQIAASISPVDAVVPPRVKPNYLRTLPRRRKRRRSLTSGGPEDGDPGDFFGDGGDGGSPFGSGGGGGKGWNFDGFGWSDWDESNNSPANLAFDVVYEVIWWIALSNCLHFVLKKVARIVTAANGIDDPAREKVPIRFTAIC